MARIKNKPRTSETARKSTGAIQAGPTPQARVGDSTQLFAREERRLTRRVQDEARFTGPTGLGIGKGGMKRIRAAFRKQSSRPFLPRKRDIQRRVDSQPSSIPLAPFSRLLRSILQNLRPEFLDYRFQVAAIQVLRDVTETYTVDMFETAYLFTSHCGRVTLMPRDLNLYERVKGRPDFNPSIIIDRLEARSNNRG